MASKKFTTNRPGPRRTPSPPPPALDPQASERSATTREAIETERIRLMAADSVLACIEIALDPQAPSSLPPPHLPAALSIARQLLNKSIHHLDSVELARLSRRPKR